jgi:hypothetical protein
MGDVVPFDRGEPVTAEEAREVVARLRYDLAACPVGTKALSISPYDLEVALIYIDHLESEDDDEPDGPGDGERMVA